ncbi:hypothetical protein CAPTEDRAFT_184985 [Capitella teleta]|uniref:THAP-type domain-containing protein n=1 Tax=Capitella teleta TaxID=283909 RepID=R7T6A5_CAPTE|nr:hypothetical protein CAPTEDRAFT_184985 [Capitella teleta]|eukprot:ELT88808.1 hypothetical protein CAPTEDRAFT_184985 [Capitella teleta]
MGFAKSNGPQENVLRIIDIAMQSTAAKLSNRSARDVDSRTGEYVRFHQFPDPQKKRELCLKWIAHARRADLNISNVKHKFICSIHFEPQTYACPTNIAQSSLMPNATPALITCPNPSITPKRRRPRDRSTAPPAKKRKLMTPEAGSEASDDVHPMEELPPPPTPTPSPSLDMSKNFKEHDRLAQALTDMIALRSQYQAQSRKLNRLQERLEAKL